MLSKFFITRVLPQGGQSIQIDTDKVLHFWNKKCSKEFKLTSMCFFSKELIDIVNKTNSKLLYAELLSKASEQAQIRQS